MKTRESEEMYLETIFLLTKKLPSVRSIDVVEELGYAKSSVSRAVNLLAKKGYIAIDGGGVITLTELGKDKSFDIYERHRVITLLLEYIGADSASAEENACRIEHVISPEMFSTIKKFVERTESKK